MPRLIDVLTDKEREMERRIAELHDDVRRLEAKKDRMGEDLAMLEADIEHAEQKKRRQASRRADIFRSTDSTDWTKFVLKNGMNMSGGG